MFDIISVGSATCDLFLKSADFPLGRDSIGGKIEIDELMMTAGGGGTNTAAGFARLGLKSACVARFGDDMFGKFVFDELQREKFDKRFLIEKKGDNTDYSTILVNPDGSRTILVYRGKTGIDGQVFPQAALEQTKWLYLASIEGNVDLLLQIIDWASQKGIQIVLNPGNRELKDKSKLKHVFPKLKALILNQEEAEMLGVVDRPNGAPEIVVITGGRKGAVLYSKEKNLRAKIFVDKVIDETGAGDAFSCGFVTGLIKGWKLEEALKLGMANGAAVVSKMGAKPGLLYDYELEGWMRRDLVIEQF